MQKGHQKRNMILSNTWRQVFNLISSLETNVKTWKDVCQSDRSISSFFSTKLKFEFLLLQLEICPTLNRLNKEDLVRMLLDYQGKFNSILNELKNDLNELKTESCKLESDLHTSRNVNDKLSDKVVVLERKCHANERNIGHSCWSGR